VNGGSRPFRPAPQINPSPRDDSGSIPRAAERIADLPEPIASRIDVNPVAGCWVARGPVDRDGYARYRDTGLHRVVRTLLIGEIPDGLVLDHVKARGCQSKACCWPGHLGPVTHRTNVLRGTSFAAVNYAKVSCDNGHEYDLLNTYFRPDGHRDCRTCIRRRVAEYKARQRSELARAA
jgi:hypothetical protein